MVRRHHDHHAQCGKQNQQNEFTSEKFAGDKVSAAVNDDNSNGNRNCKLQKHCHTIDNKHAVECQTWCDHWRGDAVNIQCDQCQRPDRENKQTSLALFRRGEKVNHHHDTGHDKQEDLRCREGKVQIGRQHVVKFS